MTTGDLGQVSPTLKWIALRHTNTVGSLSPDSTTSFQDLWMKAINHGFRARRITESLVSSIMVLLPGFRTQLDDINWIRCFDDFQKRYSYLWFLGLATQYMKFHTACLFNRLMDQSEYPPPPKWCPALFNKPGHFLGGIGYIFVRFIKSHPDISGRYRAASSFLHWKRGAPPVTQFELDQATADWYKMLMQPENAPVDSFDVSPSCFSEFKLLTKERRRQVLAFECRRTVSELFTEPADLSTMKLPSLSSHATSTRAQGGAFAKIYNDFVGSEPRFESSIDRQDVNTGEIGKDVIGKKVGLNVRLLKREKISNGFVWPGAVSNYDGSPFCYKKKCTCHSQKLEEKWMDESCFECIEENPWLYGSFYEFVTYIAEKQLWDEKNEVYPVALPEPLKVRLISRGPVYRYWFGGAVQKWMHTVLRQHGTFRAIGRPLCPEDLDEVLKGCDPGWCYLSGDYKAATDLIDPYLSRSVCNQLQKVGGFDDFYGDLLREGLTGAILKTPLGDINSKIPFWENQKEKLSEPLPKEIGQQTWGQLMGSPLSFPILCIINAAVNRYFYELMLREDELEGKCIYSLYRDQIIGRVLNNDKPIVNIKSVPMLINGDDVLLKCQKRFYDDWKEMVKSAGLVPSIGKNYVSERFVIINSTLYRRVEDMIGGHFQEEPYINLGLLHPQREFMPDGMAAEVTLDESHKDLGQISSKLVKGFSPEVQDHLISIFLSDPEVKRKLQKVKKGVSYFVSPALGGVGIYTNFRDVLSNQQIGYYTRLAEDVGRDIPVFEHLGASNPLRKLYDKVPRVELFTDFLQLDELSTGPSRANLLETYADLTDAVEDFELQRKLLSAQESNLRYFNGRPLSTYFGEGDDPTSKRAFREVSRPWPVHVLLRFPWVKTRVEMYQDSPCYSFEAFKSFPFSEAMLTSKDTCADLSALFQ